MTQTPELDKMRAIHDDSQTIGEFLEWATANGYHFTRTTTVEVDAERLMTGRPYTYDKVIEVPAKIDDALADYFKIDLAKAQAEKDALYAELRAKSVCQRGATDPVTDLKDTRS